MYYKIKELSKTRKIILHYFSYKENRGAAGLENICERIYVYKRKNIFLTPPFSFPHIVSSRINNELIDRLNKDDDPVLLEGIHCSGVLPYLKKSRQVVLRMHNDEAEYYHRLADNETGFLKKNYYRMEAKALKAYQSALNNDIALACVSHSDIEVLKTTYHKNNLHYIPSFTPWQEVSSAEGSGNYCLYHGNMEISENRQMVEWLFKNVFAETATRFIVAGKGAAKLALDPKTKNIEIHPDPSDAELNELIRHAHINILPSLNNTGLKLKMLHALMVGRHCLTNDAGVAGTAFHDVADIANTPIAFTAAIDQLMKKPFTKEMADIRRTALKEYSNHINAEKLNALLY